MDIANCRLLYRFQQGLNVHMTAFYAGMISCCMQIDGMEHQSESSYQVYKGTTFRPFLDQLTEIFSPHR